MGKKLITALMAATMLLSLAACGGKTPPASSDGDGDTEGKLNIAMVTDSGDITDQSFNQTTYEAAKAWADANDANFTYYKPEGDTVEARNASVDQAAAAGADVILLPGYLFAATVVQQAELYPDIKFIALDVGAPDILEAALGETYTKSENPEQFDVTEYYNTENVYCCTYQEALSGYMAGYTAVQLGYKHLGFLGGMAVPAVTRFGYGYVQGADAAAKELGIENEVTVEYVCGGQFSGDADITAFMDTWYGSRGVEVVFACGGGIYTSAAEAAVKTGGKVIGVDSDQAPIIDTYAEGLTITSAMKGLSTTVKDMLTYIKDGKWDEHVGKIESLGLVSEVVEENYVQLPIDSTQWSESYTEEDYRALVKAMFDGEITVSDDISAMPKTTITVNDYGSIK